MIFGLPFWANRDRRHRGDRLDGLAALLRAFDAQYLAGQPLPNEKIVLDQGWAILYSATAQVARVLKPRRAQRCPKLFRARNFGVPPLLKHWGRKDFYHSHSRIMIRIKGRQNKGRNNGNGSRTTGTGKMAKSKIQTQTGKDREKSGT